MLKRIALVLVLVAGALVGTAFTAASSNAASSNCNGVFTNTTFNAVIVPSWATCEIANSEIKGSVTVKPNGAFKTCTDLIDGSVTATQGYVNIDHRTQVLGSIVLNKPGIQQIPAGHICSTDEGVYSTSSYICPNYIGGNLTVENGPKYGLNLEVGDCGWIDIAGSFTISGNRLLVEAGQFDVTGSLVCVNNNPLPQFFGLFHVGGTTVGCLYN
jgi:hypothetical protein